MLARPCLAALLLAAACVEPRSTACADGRYCAADMVCATGDTCLAEPGACALFADGTPCLHTSGRGHCGTGACIPGVRLFGSASESIGTPVGGVVVRVLDHPEVIPGFTMPDGTFSLTDVPRNQVVVLELSKPDHLPTLTRELFMGTGDYLIDDNWGSHLPVIPPSIALTAAEQAGIGYRPERGIVAACVHDPAGLPLGDATVMLAAGGDGPIYVDQAGNVVDREGSDPATGIVIHMNVEPGTVTITATHPSLPNCAAAGPDDAEQIVAPVAAGSLTYVGMITCRP